MPITMWGAGLAQTTPGQNNPPPPPTGIQTEGGSTILTEGGAGIQPEGSITAGEPEFMEWMRIWKLFLFALLFVSMPAWAQPISSFSPATTPLGGDELMVGVQPGSCRGSSSCNKQITVKNVWDGMSIPDTAQVLPYTIQAGDLMGLVALTGAGNLTINAGTVTAGKYVCVTNINPIGGGNNATIVGTINGAPAILFPGGGGCVIARANGTYDWSPGPTGGDTALLSIAQQFLKPQRTNIQTPALVTGVFTPDFSAAQNFTINLVHASCPCSIANPTNLPTVGIVQEGMFKIVQSSTGSDTLTFSGSDFQTPGGVASITLSTSANATDYIPYHIDDGARIILGGLTKGPVH